MPSARFSMSAPVQWCSLPGIRVKPYLCTVLPTLWVMVKVTSSHNYCLHAPACCPVTIRPSLTPCTPYNCTQLGSWHIFPLSATAWLDITVTCAAYDLSLFAAATADTLGTTLLPCLLKHPVFLSSLCSCLHSHDPTI